MRKKKCIKGLLSSVLFCSVGSSALAMDESMAEKILIHSPSPAMSKKIPPQYKDIEQLAVAMFSSDKKISLGEGYKNYLIVKNKADLSNPYASYNVGLYQIINRSFLKVDYNESLLYLKLAADGGIDDAMYSLALIYLNNTDEVAASINGPELIQSLRHKDVINEDKKRLREIGQQYVLDLARRGHEKAFMTACNFYTTGQIVTRSINNAALCYNNAINIFDSSIAKGLLAKIYFEVPEFNSIEFERLGVELSKQAATQGNMYAMVNLGKQLIKPNHIGRENVGLGVELLQNAAAHGDERAMDLLTQYLGDDGVLRMKNKSLN